MIVLKGQERRDLQDFIAYKQAAWEIEFETSEFYAEARERGCTIVPFDRSQVISSIPDTYNGRRLRNDEKYDRYVLINISDAFVKETQKRVAYWRREIKEFGND